MRGHILVIDDEEYVYEDLEFGLGKAHHVHYAATLNKITSKFNNYPIDLAMVDLEFIMPGKKEGRFSGLGYIKTLRSKYPTITIVVLSGYSDEGKIVQATKNGADFYLIKGNFDTDSHEFREQVRKWINAKKKLDQQRHLEELDSWGIAEFTEDVMTQCQALIQSKESFLLIGEAGLGKRKLLEQSYKKSRSFRYGKEPEHIELSAFESGDIHNFLYLKRGSTPDNFLKHATVKIQYIRNLESQPLSIQESFLRLLQSGRFLNRKELFKHQLVFILERDPAELIRENQLSPELVSYLPQLRIKPLRERRGDLKELISGWLDRKGYDELSFSEKSLKLLRHYAYPGNTSELFSLLNEAVEAHKKQMPLSWKQEVIQAESLPCILHQTPSELFEEMQYEVARVHLRFIEKALQQFEGERRQKNLTAEALNVHSADNLKKTYINKYWREYRDLVKGFPTIMKKYKLKLNGK